METGLLIIRIEDWISNRQRLGLDNTLMDEVLVKLRKLRALETMNRPLYSKEVDKVNK